MDTFHDGATSMEDKQAITACAFIHHNFNGVEKVFLSKRAKTKKFLPGNFETPGGHIDFGEDIRQGLKREVMEEHGMNISIGDPFAVFTYNNDVKKSHSVEVMYFAKFTDPIENIKINPEDHSEFIWVSENEIPEIGKISLEEHRDIKRGFELLKGGSLIFG